MPGGRPPKLTPELQQRIIQAIQGGAYREKAAQFAGIAPETLSRWMSRRGSPYAEFSQAVLEAEAHASVIMALRVSAAAKDDWRAAAWWLERKFPDEWGRKDQHKITDGNGEPVIPLDFLRQAFERATKRAED
ncbi:hypothetical protein K2Z84_05250 [Candidatus Binatia bacterium]|nr:hypothetical protein [Candidatus Binatia bacterium]